MALLIAGIEKLFGIAPVPSIITVVFGVAIVNDSTSDVLVFHTLSVVNTLR